ncbi:DNA-directed RNA polymerase subunit omega [bacterium]|nr:DNA-directed RNA polymerase subunit omega [bacterium]
MEKDFATIEVDNLNRFETVLLAAKRARQINQLRVLKQKQLEKKVIEKEKSTTLALKEIDRNLITYKYSTSKEKKQEEIKEQQRPRGLKTVF